MSFQLGISQSTWINLNQIPNLVDLETRLSREHLRTTMVLSASSLNIKTRITVVMIRT